MKLPFLKNNRWPRIAKPQDEKYIVGSDKYTKSAPDEAEKVLKSHDIGESSIPKLQSKEPSKAFKKTMNMLPKNRMKR